ncbi:MAG: hypothetical protein JST27_11925 [Bacteroidetes bacterium]|nr:hypothetical protein [Bacteroidota bacterium]
MPWIVSASSPPIPQEGSVEETILTTANTQIIHIGNDVLLAFLSPDSTITLRVVNHAGDDRKIPLREAFGIVPAFPNSFTTAGDTFFLYYKDEAQLLKINPTGQVLAALPVSHNAGEVLNPYSDPLAYYHGQFFLCTILDDAPPNFLPSFCDRILVQRDDSLVAEPFTQGRYPANYTNDWVILRSARRTILPDGKVVYGFAGSDSLFCFDARGNLQWQGKIESKYGGYFAHCDPKEMSNLNYLSQYYRTEEQNLFFKFNPVDSTLFLVKKLRDTTAQKPYTDLIVLGKDLNTKKEIRLKGQPLMQDIFFMQQDTLFSGSLYTGWVTQYTIVHEK